MTQTIQISSRKRVTRNGFTLVELLVVIAIMSALTALMLPRLRTVNEDRGIREAARVVGSKFAEASDRARRDGKASVTLIRNANMVDAFGVQYASSTIYLSRAVPNFTGDDRRALGRVTSSTTVTIRAPLEYEPLLPSESVVRAGDSVRLQAAPTGPVPVTSPVAYRIEGINVSGPNLILTLENNRTLPDPPLGRVSYVIERQPKILQSSVTDLPSGYIVDLRLSGPLVPLETANNSGIVDSTGSPINIRPLFFEKLKPIDQGTVLDDEYDRIEVVFDSTGGISAVRTYVGGWDTPTLAGGVPERVITGPLQLFISPTELEEGTSPLYGEANLWVTVSDTSGGVNIGYNNPPISLVPGATTLADLVTEARRTAQTGQSASQ